MDRIREYLKDKERFLEENGICHMTGIRLSWWMYVGIKIFMGIFLCLFGKWMLNMEAGYLPVLFLVVFAGCDGLVRMSNENDNSDMLPDIKVLFDCLRIQVKAGVYVTDALNEIILLMKNKRLRDALKSLTDSIVLTGNLDDSLKEFNGKFCNRHIDTLVIILRQALVSGQSSESLDHAFQQMTDIEQAFNLKLENALERKVMIIQVMVLFGIFLMVGFCSICEFSGLFSAIK